MDCHELMIDDWVYIDEPDKYASCKARVQTLSNHQKDDGFYLTVYVNGDKGYTNTEVFNEDLRPIDLTKDILNHNHWIITDMYAFLNIDEHSHLEFYYHEHRLRKWWHGVDEWENHSEVKEITFQCNCYYVHELQHALKMLHIDKDIEL